MLAVLLAAGTAGFFLGIVREPAWQDAVEPAQVLAGLVSYPTDNPVYLYSTRTWTALHQALAVALRLGWSESALSLLLSGLAGMLSFQALAVVILALSGDSAASIVGPFFIYLTGTTNGGISYPVILMGEPFTYGTIGLSYTLLALAMIGAGRTRAGALLLGFGPAIHPSIGILALLAGAPALMFGEPSERRKLSRAWPFFLLGLAGAAASAALHLWQFGGGAAPAQWLAPAPEFADRWQDHRARFSFLSGDMLIIWTCGGLALVWLRWFREDVPAPARTFLRVVLASIAVGVLFSAIHWLPLASVPWILYALMPSRLLNVSVLSCMAIILGLFASYRHDPRMAASLGVMVAGWSAVALVFPGLATRNAHILASLCATGLVFLAWLSRRQHLAAPSPAFANWARLTRRAGLLVPAAIFCLTGIAAARNAQETKREWYGANDSVYAAAARRSGVLLTAGNLHHVQLHTRRPVLMDGGAMDALSYVPQNIPAADRILREVYGIDAAVLSDPGEYFLDLEPERHRRLWEERTVAAWQRIAAAFGVTEVLTPGDWALQLPPVMRSGELALYTIPPVVR